MQQSELMDKLNRLKPIPDTNYVLFYDVTETKDGWKAKHTVTKDKKEAVRSALEHKAYSIGLYDDQGKIYSRCMIRAMTQDELCYALTNR